MSAELALTSWPEADPIPLPDRHPDVPVCSAPPIPLGPCPVCPRLALEFEPWRQAASWQARHQRAVGREAALNDEIARLPAQLRLREPQLFGRKTDSTTTIEGVAPRAPSPRPGAGGQDPNAGIMPAIPGGVRAPGAGRGGHPGRGPLRGLPGDGAGQGQDDRAGLLLGACAPRFPHGGAVVAGSGDVGAGWVEWLGACTTATTGAGGPPQESAVRRARPGGAPEVAAMAPQRDDERRSRVAPGATPGAGEPASPLVGADDIRRASRGAERQQHGRAAGTGTGAGPEELLWFGCGLERSVGGAAVLAVPDVGVGGAQPAGLAEGT